jgi:hypothetical protein
MNGDEKSDLAVVAVKPANEPVRPGKEWVEPRAGAEGNARDSHGVRAQNRATPSSGIDRVRKAAQERKAEKFTTLLHHIDATLLTAAVNAFFDLPASEHARREPYSGPPADQRRARSGPFAIACQPPCAHTSGNHDA